MTLQVVIAHDLLSGVVIFMKQDGSWSSAVNDAAAVEKGAAADALLEKSYESRDRQEVLGCELIDVTVESDQIIPVRLRERIRAFGPTIPFGADA